MKNKILIPIIAAGTALLTGCGTNAHTSSPAAARASSASARSTSGLHAGGRRDDGDLIASGVLSRVPNPPAVLAISRIVNNTGQQIDMDLLTKKIRIGLLQSGKAVTTTTFGLGGTAEDPMAKGIQQENQFKSDQNTTRLPDFTLSGSIIQLAVKAGDTSQSTYSFQLSLTDPNPAWPCGKARRTSQAGHRSSVGF